MSTMTKKAFAASLKKFMQNKPVTKITVKEIVNDCGVGRKTFYYHFQDIYELLGWIYITEAIEVLADCKTYETWQTGLRKIVCFVYDNKIFCKNAYYSIGRDRAVNFLYPVITSLLMDVLNNLSQNISIDPNDKAFIADFYAYAFIGLIIKWSLSDMKDPEEFMNRLSILVEDDLNMAIKKFSR